MGADSPGKAVVSGRAALARPDRAPIVTVEHEVVVLGGRGLVQKHAVHDAFAAVVCVSTSSVGVGAVIAAPVVPGVCAPLYDLPTMSRNVVFSCGFACNVE